MEFNKEQIKAINHYKGACAVIAGAGSGKSTILTHRIKNLVDIHNVEQKDILAVSFTNNTAKELKKKLANMGYTNINIGTFHAICLKIFSDNNINIKHDNLIKEWQVKKCLSNIDVSANDKDIMSFIGYQKSYMRNYYDVFMVKDSKYTEDELRLFYKEYETYKLKNKLYDMDDWLLECYKLLQKINLSYDFVLVDEHQDSNLIQNLILKSLCKSGNMFAVFDYRQAIYTFRGGNPEYCMNFSYDWNNAVVINLDTNYRSTNNIVTNANGFIKKYYGDYEHYSDSISNNKEHGKINTITYESRSIEGLEVINKVEELLKSNENPSDIAILYRLNSQSSYLENELRKRGIQYNIANESSFFKRKEVMAIISYLRLIQNPHDDGAFDNIFKLRNYPLAFFSNEVFDKINTYSGKNNLSLYESFISIKYDKDWLKVNMDLFKDNINRLQLQLKKGISIDNLIDNIKKVFKLEEFLQEKYKDEEDLTDRLNSTDVIKSFIRGNNLEKFLDYVDDSTSKKKTNNNLITLMTIHGSKGLEFKHIFLIGVEDTKFPHAKSDISDEARLFYVGVTRAKENLYLSQIGEGNRFIREYTA
jgi:DNA helicase-2/ATP-dependent DNA helicase PcrA